MNETITKVVAEATWVAIQTLSEAQNSEIRRPKRTQARQSSSQVE